MDPSAASPLELIATIMTKLAAVSDAFAWAQTKAAEDIPFASVWPSEALANSKLISDDFKVIAMLELLNQGRRPVGVALEDCAKLQLYLKQEPFFWKRDSGHELDRRNYARVELGMAGAFTAGICAVKYNPFAFLIPLACLVMSGDGYRRARRFRKQHVRMRKLLEWVQNEFCHDPQTCEQFQLLFTVTHDAYTAGDKLERTRHALQTITDRLAMLKETVEFNTLLGTDMSSARIYLQGMQRNTYQAGKSLQDFLNAMRYGVRRVTEILQDSDRAPSSPNKPFDQFPYEF